MKKVSLYILVLTLIFPVLAFAEIDWSAMTTEEIQSTIDSGRAEILSREIKMDEKGTVLLEADGLLVVLSSISVEDSYDGSKTLKCDYIVTNNGSESIGFRTDKVYLNGWDVDSFFISSSLDAGKKAKETSYLYGINESADVNSYEELEELELTFLTYDGDTYSTKTNDIKMTLYFNK